ncbi:uncharacterized protein [Asterias amurensis]|uniref:uncharacterized protein n=1 Tax=Asterias amurensis TaxID=7602 RepID=UPI003AB553C2
MSTSEEPWSLEGRKHTVSLPSDQPSWSNVKTSLKNLSQVLNTEALLPALGKVYRAAHPSQFNWHTDEPLVETSHPFVGLGHFLEHVASETERSVFFRRVLPTIARLAEEMERWCPREGVQYSSHQEESLQSLDRRFIATMIANAFLCTFPKQQSVTMNGVNFDEFFQFLICSSTRNSQAAKLRCFLNYFDRLAGVDMENFSGQISYIRQVLHEDETISLEGWLDSKADLCPLTIRHIGRIEHAGSHALQVDFANQFIGRGTLGAGRIQEEIRFCTCPELLGCLSFMESLHDNEAIVITGFEQFSECSGYSSTLKFCGDFRDTGKKDITGNFANTLIAIDAMPWSGYLQNQFKTEHILRELNKAFTGFCYPKSERRTLSVGHGEADSGSYQDALDQSLISTDGTFDTASSGDNESRKSSCNSNLHGYSGSLSRAITDIAIKDATGSFPSLNLSRDESSHNSLSTVLTMSNASTPRDENEPMQNVVSGLSTGPLEDFAGGLVDKALRESQPGLLLKQDEPRAMQENGLSVSEVILADGSRVESGSGEPSEDQSHLQSQARSLVSCAIQDAVGVIEGEHKSTSKPLVWTSNNFGATLHSREEAVNNNTTTVYSSGQGRPIMTGAESIGTLLSIDKATISHTDMQDRPNKREVCDIHRENGNEFGATLQTTDMAPNDVEDGDRGGASPFKNDSQVTPSSPGRDSRSSKGSLGDFSLISSTSCPSSDSFVKLNGEGDILFRQRHPNQPFSADIMANDILQDALGSLRKHFNISSGIHTTSSGDSLEDLSEVHSATFPSRDPSGSFENLTSCDLSSSSCSEYVHVKVANFSVDTLAQDIIASAFEELNNMIHEMTEPSLKDTGELIGEISRPAVQAKDGSDKGRTGARSYFSLTEEDIRNGNTLQSERLNDQHHGAIPSASTADSFAEKFIGQIFQESLQGRGPIAGGNQTTSDPGTPPPSPTSPTSLEACLQTPQSLEKSLVTISEQPAIKEPQYDGDKRLSNDSSGTESSQSREARIRECAEQLVARTLPESVRLLGGSAQTTSSNSSRRSSARSSIPNSSNRSSMDCFTEDLLKIANIDPMGKRPSRTEENLAFFAQEIKRMAEAEEKAAKKQKEDFADFTIELQRRSSQSQVLDGELIQVNLIDSLAEKQSNEVISDVFVRLFGKPWSEAEHTDDPEPEPESKPSRQPTEKTCEQSEYEELALIQGRTPRRPSEQDLICMATNLANSIIEAALKVYREEHLHLPTTQGGYRMAPIHPEEGHGTPSDQRGVASHQSRILTLDEFASATAESILDQAKQCLSKVLKERGAIDKEEVSPTGHRPISTGNWGCGAFGGDPQLKSLIQWMAASQAGSPRLIYYTFGDERISRLQRVINETESRQWTVGDLFRAVLDHSWLTLNVDSDPLSLFERIIKSV